MYAGDDVRCFGVAQQGHHVAKLHHIVAKMDVSEEENAAVRAPSVVSAKGSVRRIAPFMNLDRQSSASRVIGAAGRRAGANVRSHSCAGGDVRS